MTTKTTKTTKPASLAIVSGAMFAAARSDAMAQDMLRNAFALARKNKIDLVLIRRDYVAGYWAKKIAGDLTDAQNAQAYSFADSAGVDVKKLADGQRRRTKAEDVLHAAARKAWSRALHAIEEKPVDNRGASGKGKKRKPQAGKVADKPAERTPAEVSKAIAEIVAAPPKATTSEHIDNVAHLNNGLMSYGKKHAKDIPGSVAAAIAKATAEIAKAVGDWRVASHDGAAVKVAAE